MSVPAVPGPSFPAALEVYVPINDPWGDCCGLLTGDRRQRPVPLVPASSGARAVPSTSEVASPRLGSSLLKWSSARSQKSSARSTCFAAATTPDVLPTSRWLNPTFGPDRWFAKLAQWGARVRNQDRTLILRRPVSQLTGEGQLDAGLPRRCASAGPARQEGPGSAKSRSPGPSKTKPPRLSV